MSSFAAPADKVAINPFSLKLRRLAGLGEQEIAAIDALCHERRHIAANREVTSESAEPEHIHVLLDGWAARQKLFPDGRRQFSALLVPGDICDVDGLFIRRYDCGVATLTACTFAVISRAELLRVINAFPAVGHVITWFACVENSMLTTRMAMLGRASARERIAHLFCELLARLQFVGLADGDSTIQLPITQETLSDVTGLTPVHVNRTLQVLRANELIRLEGHRLAVPDPDRLRQVSGFSPDYLHLDGIRQRA